jgi:Tfp pilus assembly protein PilX
LSFQAAESALRATETFIESQTVESFFDTTDMLYGIYNQTDDEPEDLFAINWDVNNSAIAGRLEGDPLELEGVAFPPRYMIKKLKKIDDETVFRVTVRGTGGTNNRATLLRSHYAKVFGADSVGRLSWEQLFPSQ